MEASEKGRHKGSVGGGVSFFPFVTFLLGTIAKPSEPSICIESGTDVVLRVGGDNWGEALIVPCERRKNVKRVVRGGRKHRILLSW